MKTKVWNAVLGLLGSVVIFLFNLFCPKRAAEFVRDNNYFSDFWRGFYTKCALKWPLLWSKHWITLEKLKTCSIHKQVAYYWVNRYQAEVLKAMSPEAQVVLVRNHPEWIDWIDAQMCLTNEMFAEWMKCIVIEERKYHPYRGHWMRVYASLDDYLRTRKLPFSKVMLLVQAVVEEYSNSKSPLMDMLKDYIERFGLSKKQLEEIAQYMSDNLYWHDTFAEKPVTEMEKELEKYNKFNHFYNMLNERQINYDQRVFTRSQRGERRTDEWRTFCEKTNYICIAAQEEMDIEQYKVFHATGHTLRTEVIFDFLNYPDRNLHRLVFRYEPLDMFEKKDVKKFITDIRFKKVFEEEMAKRNKKKSKKS